MPLYTIKKIQDRRTRYDRTRNAVAQLRHHRRGSEAVVSPARYVTRHTAASHLLHREAANPAYRSTPPPQRLHPQPAHGRTAALPLPPPPVTPPTPSQTIITRRCVAWPGAVLYTRGKVASVEPAQSVCVGL